MPDQPFSSRLDEALQALMSGAEGGPLDRDLAQFVDLARDLRDLPRESFRARLKANLERRPSMASMSQTAAPARQTVAPRLRIKGAAAAIEFYQRAFEAREVMRFEVQGQVAHAEIAIGNATIMIGEESLEHGFPAPESLGGSPVGMQVWVDNADAAVERAVAAGGRLVSPLTNQFYGHRTGHVADPFGYTWALTQLVEEMSVEEMHRRLEMMQASPRKPAVDPVREGFRTLTPYLVATNAPALVDFVKRVFDAEETFRAVGGAGGLHCEVRLGDSMMMIGGGGEGMSWSGDAQPMAFHVYVRDVDAIYRRAMDAGCESIQGPTDQQWGERTASVKDPHGNHWYIATYKGENYYSPGAPTVQPYLHPLRADPVIRFLKRAFGAVELGRYTAPDGVVHHTTIKIGTSAMELGEAQGPYQPMPSMFFLYVPDVDGTYRNALAAGATSMTEPADQSYGDRTAAVKDIFGNQWYIATHIGQK